MRTLYGTKNHKIVFAALKQGVFSYFDRASTCPLGSVA